jgi:hypothetical protein
MDSMLKELNMTDLQFIPISNSPSVTPCSSARNSNCSTPKKKTEKVIIFNDDVMEKLTKDITPASILIKHSRCIDDEVLLAIVLKYNLLTYECCNPGCTVKSNWRRKPIKLIVNRKNSKQNDLRIENLQLLCPNCYTQNYGGTQILKEIIQLRTQVCRICNYDKVHLLADIYKRSGYCTICYKKIQDTQSSAQSVINTDLLLYKSIESAQSGTDIELSLDDTKSLTAGIRDLMPKNLDLRDVAAFMGSSIDASKTLKTKVRKVRTPKNNASCKEAIHINCLEDIKLDDLINPNLST